MEEASVSVHILVSRLQHARGGGGQHRVSCTRGLFVLACMGVQCVDPSGHMNSVGSVISCVSRNKVGPGVLVNATSIDRSVSH